MVDTSRLEAIAATHREQGLQAGSQVFVSIAGSPVVHFADGEATPGRPLDISNVMRWYEAGMPLVAIAAGRLIDKGRLRLDDPVERYIKNWGNGKQACTVRHLLTHMGGFAGAELADRDMSDLGALSSIAAYRAEYTPGTKASFHPSSGWRVLSAVVEAVEKRPMEKIIERTIFKPLGMRRAAFTRLEPKTLAALGSSISPVHWAGLTVTSHDEEGTVVDVPHQRDLIHNTPWHMSKWEPAQSAWGSAAALGRIYEALLGDAETFFDNPSTIEMMTAVHRDGLVDRTLGASVPWGLGFQVAASFGGSVGYRAFGHGGLTGRAVCDPVDKLVMVYLTNGLATRANHERRMSEMADAIYETVMPRSLGAWVTTSLPAVGVS